MNIEFTPEWLEKHPRFQVTAEPKKGKSPVQGEVSGLYTVASISFNIPFEGEMHCYGSVVENTLVDPEGDGEVEVIGEMQMGGAELTQEEISELQGYKQFWPNLIALILQRYEAGLPPHQ